MNAMRRNFAEANEMILRAKRILVSGHLSPDGDSLGSMIALVRLLKAVGKDAVATADINALGKLGFLEGAEDLVPVKKLRRQKSFDLFIAVDNSGFERMPAEVRPVAEKLPKICIDHHVTNNNSFADVTILDPDASSTGELIWRFAKWNEWALDRVVAEALWVAIITDSGRFAYDCTQPGTLRAASDILKHGVRTSWINDVIYGMFPRRAIELKRRAWRTLHVWKNRRVAEVTLTRDDFRSVRGTKADAEDIIEIPRSVSRNEIALFFYQIPDRTKETRCSIRTRGDWDATQIATRFGGGGHVHAAGCTVDAPLSAAKRQVRSAVKELLKSSCRKTSKIQTIKSLVLAFATLICVSSFGSAIDLNTGWESEMTSEKGLKVKRSQIRIPHNWDDYFGMRGFRHGNLHGSAVYRRTFTASNLAKRRSFLVFEGAGSYLTVRLNGKVLCERRPAGRLVTTLEATNVAIDGVNNLEVVCDHPSEIQDLPWHCGGCSGIGSEGPEPFGLFRKVRFETTDDVRIAPFGVHIWHDGECKRAFVTTEITSAALGGKRVLSVECPELGIVASEEVTLSPYTAITNKMSFAIPSAERWSPENPKLYYFDVRVGDEHLRVRTGFATYRWPIYPFAKDRHGNDEHRFLLNGKPVFLHGTCETDNRFGSNAAFDEEEIDARAAELKRLGMNFWRDGHEPHDLRFNRHWDELGIVWWPQISTHTYFDTPEFKRNFLQAIEQWVKERRNSPSVALWGLQNESVIIEDFAKECTELIHRLDPLSGPKGRAVTTCNYGTGADWNVIQNWSGCYSGEVRNYQHELCRTNQLLNGEYGAWRAAFFHSDPDAPYVKAMPWTEEHAAHVLWQKAIRGWDVRDHVCGQLLWTFFSHENPGRLNTNVDDSYRVIDKVGPLNPKGIYTIWGQRVAAWYMYRSYGERFKNGNLEEGRYLPLSRLIEEGRSLVAPKPSPVFSPTPVLGRKYLHRLNCGGDAVVDSCGNKWSADSTSYTRSWSQYEYLQDPRLKMNPVLCSQGQLEARDGGVVNAAAADQALFSTYRFGRELLTITFPVPAGCKCFVEMYFIEPGSYGRVFDIALNGNVVQSKFDLGSMPERTLVKREFSAVGSADGKIVVSFPRVWCNQAVVSAIAVSTEDQGVSPAAVEPGYPQTQGLTWQALSSQVRAVTTKEFLPESESIKLAPLTPLQTARNDPAHNADMKSAAYLYRVASDYSVTILVKGDNRRGKKLRWSLERPDGEGWKVEAQGVSDIPEEGERFSISMGTTLNAGYYVFYYQCDGLEVSAREMK